MRRPHSPKNCEISIRLIYNNIGKRLDIECTGTPSQEGLLLCGLSVVGSIPTVLLFGGLSLDERIEAPAEDEPVTSKMNIQNT